MSIFEVTNNNDSAANGADFTLDLAAFATININDLLIAGGGYNGSVPTNHTTILSGSDYGYRVVTNTSQASVAIQGDGNTAHGVSAVGYAFRGVDTTTPLDVTTTSSSGASSLPNPPAITPASDDCMIVVLGFTEGFSGTLDSVGGPTGYSSCVWIGGSDTNKSVAYASYLLLSGGAGVSVDPTAFDTGVTGSWVCWTLALRPMAEQPFSKRFGGVMHAGGNRQTAGGGVRQWRRRESGLHVPVRPSLITARALHG